MIRERTTPSLLIACNKSLDTGELKNTCALWKIIFFYFSIFPHAMQTLKAYQLTRLTFCKEESCQINLSWAFAHCRNNVIKFLWSLKNANDCNWNQVYIKTIFLRKKIHLEARTMEKNILDKLTVKIVFSKLWQWGYFVLLLEGLANLWKIKCKYL